MELPTVTLADWRAQIEKELAGKSFDKALVHQTLEGISIAPLYIDAPPTHLLREEARDAGFRICMRHLHPSLDSLAEEAQEGADAAWVTLDETPAGVFARDDLAGTFFVLDAAGASSRDAIDRLTKALRPGRPPMFAVSYDPLARCARGESTFAALPSDLATLGQIARLVEERVPGKGTPGVTSATSAMVSTLAYHDAGADAADELAFALSTGVRYLEALREAGLSADQAARQVALQISVGRDTFLELSKIRALRTCWQKLVTAAGASEVPQTVVHAVCSSRTMSARDPWVNMLRVTTQVFSAVLGGADLVTPNAFDEALGGASVSGRRIARNTGLVLREESFLGKVIDPAGGSYYVETLTDALAREAWKRFQALEREGGIAAALESGRLFARLEGAWHARLEQIARRKTAIVGVSEFANLDETLPAPATLTGIAPDGKPTVRLLAHRDAEPFEALRLQAEAAKSAPEALLVTLGTLAETRPRAGFAAGFFTAGGIRAREGTVSDKADIACICGTDERYAAEAPQCVRALKAAGVGRVLVAGRPGALETTLRAAGVDGFIFVGCDAVAVLSEVLEGLS